MPRDQVFISYSHKDAAWLDQLKATLAPMIRSRKIELWDDSRIKPGQRWKEEIGKALARARVAVLLVSKDFLASGFIATDELPPILDAQAAEGLTIIWVPVGACLYRKERIAEYQAAFDPKRPLKAMSEHEVEVALVTVAEQIEAALAQPDPEPVTVQPPTSPQPAVLPPKTPERLVATAPVKPSVTPEPLPVPLPDPGDLGGLARREMPPTLTLDCGGGAAMELVLIPRGEFFMGPPESEQGHSVIECPQHPVRFVRPFYLGRHAVTQAEWQAVMGGNPAHFTGDPRLPVESVSWEDCQEFCRRLSERAGRTIRLPSEAEWEYACRAGTTTPFSFGETISTEQANYDGNHTYGKGCKGKYRKRTVPVGSFPPNPWGLHEMHGNVWEWCADLWHDNYIGAPSDGSAWMTDGGSLSRVLRGGSWIDGPRHCRSAYRGRYSPDNRNNYYGLRIVSSGTS